MSFRRIFRCFLLAILLWLSSVHQVLAEIPPLHQAARDGRIDDVVRLVAENPSGIDDRDEKGNAAIHWAVGNGQTEVLKYLLKEGASPDIAKSDLATPDGQAGWTPLHQAAAGGQIECLKILLPYRPNLFAVDQNNQTPLHTAAWHNQTDAARLLIAAGTPVNITRKDKVIPIEIAAYFGHLDMVKLLIASGADVNWHVYEGYTPLDQAIRNGHLDVMQVLVENGADLEARCDDGRTPLHVAASTGRNWETNLLLSMGANTEAKTKEGLTPLELAKKTGHGDTAATLEGFVKARQEMRNLIAARKLNLSGLATMKSPAQKVVYSNVFGEESVGSEWTIAKGSNATTAISVTDIPNTGKRFLGEFGNDTVRLSLRKLPPHHLVTVVLSLFVINTWDGGGITGGTGPDIWEARVENGPVLLRTTFQNAGDDLKRTPMQAFPGEYALAANPGRTGAVANNILHLRSTAENPSGVPDSVYLLKLSFAHSSSDLLLHFQGKNLEDLNNESWGIGKIEIRIDSIPPAKNLRRH